MTMISTKNFGASLIALAFSSMNAQAQTCTVPPTCEALGFTLTASDCVGKTTLKCPFDQNKIYCPSDNEVFQSYKLGDTYKVNGIAVGTIIQTNDCNSGVTVKDCISRSSCTTTSKDYVYDSNSSTNYLYTWTCKSTGAVIASNYTGKDTDTARNCAYAVSSCKGGGTVATVGTRSGTFKEAGNGCANVTAGGLTWYLPTSAQVKLIATYISSFSGYVWDQSGNCADKSGSSTSVGCKSYDGNKALCGYGASGCSNQNIINDFVQGYYCVAAF